MSNILSQNEVNALLKGVKSGDIDTDTAKEKIMSGVKNYDFMNQERIIRGKMPGLEIANERFTHFFKNSVSNFIMKFVDINIHNVEIVKFGDFMQTVPFPSNINIFKMEPLKGHSLLVIEAPLVFAFVEMFFGGDTASHVKAEAKVFTRTESRIIQKVVNMALDDLARAWNAIAPINPYYVDSEINPQFVTIVTPTEIIIKVEIHIEFEDFTGKFFLCIPYSMIESVKEQLYSGIQSEKLDIDQRWVTQLKDLLMDSAVELTVEVARVELTVEELMNLKEGSVINLGKAISDDFTINIEGVPKLRGMPGYSRGNHSIKVTRLL